MRTLVTPLLVLLTLLAATGCPPGRGGGDGGASTLDTDGDGDLDADDVQPGEGAIAVTYEFDDENGDPAPTEDALTTTQVRLEQTFAAWNLAATFGEGDDALIISLRFELEGSLEEGTYSVSSASARPGDASWYAYASEAGGDVVISAVGDGVGSGHFEGSAAIEILGEFEEPTGEIVRVTGFAFRDVEQLLADL
jgi:hypothetical protein